MKVDVRQAALFEKLENISYKARKYRDEIFQLSESKNVIVAMDTGTGKTQISAMRINHQLSLKDEKLIWFLVPGVGSRCAASESPGYVLQSANSLRL